MNNRNEIIIRIGENHIPSAAIVIRQSFQTVADDMGLTVENCPSNGAAL